ncbi:TetR/AcrR family transcriptional regulator [Streptomyces glaucosporus]|uniref:TetR/AcrR family transcriptional regulator n=1 Tax=Streptomyces glaucosporus TaxID=284044 RepID=A0ABN3IJE8_9ACTN
MENTLGLRERKKAATRQAVHEAALRLAVEHGFEHVTVEAIADMAGISRRTFSNYFAGKEDALLYGEEEHIRAFVRAVRDRPADEPAWTALRRAVRALFHRHGRLDPEWAVRTRLAKRHPSVLARQLANHAALERDLALALAERQCPEGVRPQVVAAAFLTAARIGMHLWTEEEQTRDPAEVIEEILDEMATPFS